MAELSELASVQVLFPEGAQYGNALYGLRKALKKVLAVEIHKQPEGALVRCSKEYLGGLILTLGTLEGYAFKVLESATPSPPE